MKNLTTNTSLYTDDSRRNVQIDDRYVTNVGYTIFDTNIREATLRVSSQPPYISISSDIAITWNWEYYTLDELKEMYSSTPIENELYGSRNPVVNDDTMSQIYSEANFSFTKTQAESDGLFYTPDAQFRPTLFSFNELEWFEEKEFEVDTNEILLSPLFSATLQKSKIKFKMKIQEVF